MVNRKPQVLNVRQKRHLSEYREMFGGDPWCLIEKTRNRWSEIRHWRRMDGIGAFGTVAGKGGLPVMEFREALAWRRRFLGLFGIDEVPALKFCLATIKLIDNVLLSWNSADAALPGKR